MKSEYFLKNNYESAKREMYQQLPTLACFENRSLFGLPFKDVNLFAIVILCILSGHFFYRIHSPNRRAIFSCLLSLSCVWLAAEGETYKAIWVTLFGLFQTSWVYAIKSTKCFRSLSLISLFTMTSALRYWLDEWLNAQLSLVLMMQLLKLVGAAFDIADCMDGLTEDIPLSNSTKRDSSKSNRMICYDCKFTASATSSMQRKRLFDQLPPQQQQNQTTTPSTFIQPKLCKHVCPESLWMLFAYAFCHCGLVLGPFFRYRVFLDWLNMDLCWAEQNQVRDQAYKQFLAKVKLFPLLFLLMLVNQQMSPLHGLVISSQKKNTTSPVDVEQSIVETILEKNVYSLILNAFLAFYFYRARLYLGFMLGEFVCMACGLGMYPVQCASLPAHGPQFEYNPASPNSNDSKFGYNSAQQSTFSNVALEDSKGPVYQKLDHSLTAIDFRSIVTCEGLQAEWTGSIRKSLRNWNLPTQYWLARHVYRPLRGYPNWLRLYTTLSISALWHGVYSGYFLSFFVLPLIFWLERPWSQYVSKVHKDSAPVFVAFWVFKILLLSYFGVPFYLLRWAPSILYWNSVYW